MKKFLLSFLVLLSAYSQACICVPQVPVSKKLCEKYDVVFHGMIDSVGACDEKERSIAYFTIIELYRGKTEKHLKVYFDCVSECLMNLMTNEEWIIYARYSKFDRLEISLCEHSRKKFNAETQDVYLLDSKRTFDEELKFLKESLGVQPIADAVVLNNAITETGRHNEQPGSWGKVILLLISVGVMLIIYFVTRRKK